MKKIRGVFLSDVHIPDNINLKPVLEFLGDFKPNLVILGGDIIDAKGLFNVDNRKASDFKLSWYKRDVKLLNEFLAEIKKKTPGAEYIYLEGNHEQRYRKLMDKFPETFGDCFHLLKDATPKGMKIKEIKYGSYGSYYLLGDCVFIHGTIYPDAHAKRYALDHTPYKCVYGHLHHFQSYTTRKAFATMTPRYAVTGGCLSTTTPEWKKGAPNQWVNGFVSFVSDGKITTPTVHLIERGRFNVGIKEYK